MTSESNFNRIAKPYRWLEYLTLGRALERCRLHFLPELLQQKNSLVIGDGDGRFLATLMAANRNLQANAVDASANMLHLLSKRCEASASDVSARLRIQHASALAFVSNGPHDLVATHFFLDCLSQSDLEHLILRIVPTLAPGALWVVSDFRIPQGFMRLPARFIVRFLYLGFRILTGLRTTRLPNYTTPLIQAGLTRIKCHYSLAGLLTTELWQLRK